MEYFPYGGQTTRFEMAPSNASMATDESRACWNCRHYSFKVWEGSEKETQGKCFRDIEKNGKVYWVEALMTCPGFEKERERVHER